MAPHRVIEELDVIEDIRSGFVACRIHFPLDSLGLQLCKEAFGYSVIMTVASTTHAGFQIVILQELAPVRAGVLDALIRVNQHPALGFTSPHRHQQCIQNQIGSGVGLHAPANDLSREEIQDNRQIQPALVGSDIRKVGHPDLIGPINLKGAIQRVRRNVRRLATLKARVSPITPQGADSGDLHQAVHPVSAAPMPQLMKV